MLSYNSVPSMNHLAYITVTIPSQLNIPAPSAAAFTGLVWAYFLFGLYVTAVLLYYTDTSSINSIQSVFALVLFTLFWPFTVIMYCYYGQDGEEQEQQEYCDDEGVFECRGCGAEFDSKAGRGIHESQWCDDV